MESILERWRLSSLSPRVTVLMWTVGDPSLSAIISLWLPFCVPFLANPSAEDLSHTYGDFKRGSSATYVTYLITTDQQTRSQGLSEVRKYEIDVGNESNTHGYYNGKLEPLGSYR